MKLYLRNINIYLKKLRKKSKAKYDQDKLKLFESDMKNTWKIINKVNGKKRNTCGSFPKKLGINKVEITDTKIIAETINNLFVEVGPNLASKIAKSYANFKTFISKVNTKLHEHLLTQDDFFRSI